VSCIGSIAYLYVLHYQACKNTDRQEAMSVFPVSIYVSTALFIHCPNNGSYFIVMSTPLIMMIGAGDYKYSSS